MPPGLRLLDPLRTFRYIVEIKGIVRAAFSEVSGIVSEIETDEFREGGVNDHVRKLPKLAKFSPLLLKRGITMDEVLWKWHINVRKGVVERQTVHVVLKDYEGNEQIRWSFLEAFPTKWSGPDLKADSSTVAIESVELIHEGLVR